MAMPTNEATVRRKSSVHVPVLTEKVLVTTILVLFLLLHGLAGAIMQRAGGADRAPPERDARDMLQFSD
jgi:hypothetical protein